MEQFPEIDGRLTAARTVVDTLEGQAAARTVFGTLKGQRTVVERTAVVQAVVVQTEIVLVVDVGTAETTVPC